MTQITSTGNNFGADPITFKTYYENGLLILNGRLTVDPQTPEFIAAETLEIYVPQLPLSRSVNTALYLAHALGSQPGLTILKSWIKDAHTICIEKDSWLATARSWELFFCNAYATKGKDATIGHFTRASMSVSGFGSAGRILDKYCFETENWTGIALVLNGLNDVVPSQGFEFELTGLTELTEFDFPMFILDSNRENNGNYFGWCHYENGHVTCDGIGAYTSAAYRTAVIYGMFIH